MAIETNKIESAAEKVAETICPHYFDSTQKNQIKTALIEFVKAIVEETREDYRKTFWP